MQQTLFFFFLKKPGIKNKKTININYLIIVPIKIKPSAFLVYSNMDEVVNKE